MIIKNFNNSTYCNDTKLSKYVCNIKEKYNKTPILKWYFVRTVPSYSNIIKWCLRCLFEKSEILYYPNTENVSKSYVECGLSTQFPHGEICHDHDFWGFSGDAPENLVYTWASIMINGMGCYCSKNFKQLY